MALPTYLSLVNDVLVRMREPQVTTVSENNVSALVGKFVNDAKRQVADAYDFQVKTKVETMTGMMGPVVLVVMGLVVGVIVMAIMVPMFEMTNIAN